MSRIFTVLLALSTAAPALAQPASVWAGVWQGTLGKYPVTACLQQDGMGGYSGAYYYEKRLRIITLRPDQDAGGASGLHFVESEAMPKRSKDIKGAKSAKSAGAAKAPPDIYARWELQAPAGDSLQGRFLGAKDAALPIALHRLGAAEDTCGSPAFTGPLHLEYKVDAGKPQGAAPYFSAALDFGKETAYQVTGFQLNAADAAGEKINLALMKTLRQEGDNAIECRNDMLDSSGYAGEYSSITEPALLTSHWLVTRNTESDDCGGAHPNASIGYATWDRTLGREVDPWTWLTPSAVKRTPRDVGAGTTYTETTVLPALQKLLTKHWPRNDEDCSDVIATASDWHVHPGLHSLIFTPDLPHVVFACTEDDDIPYAEILPLLNATGRAAVKAIEAEPAALEKKW